MEELKQIHACLLTTGQYQDGFLLSELLKFCSLSPFGDLGYARFVLYQSNNQTMCSWNTLIRAYSQSCSPKEGILVYAQVKLRGLTPNNLTFPFVLKACARVLAHREGRQIHSQILKYGFDLDIYVLNTLIHFYSCCGERDSANFVFDGIAHRTVVSWNAMISGFVQNGCYVKAIKLFEEMGSFGFEADEATMVSLLCGCTRLGNLSIGRQAHELMREKRLKLTVRLGTALIDMYSKCGDLGKAKGVFDIMEERNVWTYSAMILGMAMHGHTMDALELFEKMGSTPIKPNYVTFLGVLCACSHAGLLSKGREYFDVMMHVHGIKPMMTHYGAMVDILCRGGMLHDAYEFIESMPIDADAIVWRTLLSACSIHANIEVAEKVKKKLLEIEPSRSGNYVIISNIYAEVGMWDEVANVRRVMKHGGFKKKPGESTIEVGGMVHRFVSGDDTHQNCEDIYATLDILGLHMKFIDHMECAKL
ncbi:pentatricopeptide repeat-containing protein At2g36730 [Amborella trichopoda]|uniref:pentatricopeptide repeat-containing protein At2g36730 n=1 Tax=Amborella trichopoda TaxID=13333 RepID=UPI0005D40E7B|nr:pentatricopeptide repeat-containing protein At2g36730 [Amborella trichopoda]|eukprot:XP_011623277.1 pentatricopeptide repeat-containing protein At2g36730 [Amborella trichopoda]